MGLIGGGDIYRQTLPVADRLIITRVPLRAPGDATFPAIDPAIWEEVSRSEHAAGPADETVFSVVVYDRIRPAA